MVTQTNPFVRTSPSDPDPGKAFGTQTTSVIPVHPEKGKFIYVGDTWNGRIWNDAAKYVFLPIEFGIGSDIPIKWYNSWTPDLLNSMARLILLIRCQKPWRLQSTIPANNIECGATVEHWYQRQQYGRLITGP